LRRTARFRHERSSTGTCSPDHSRMTNRQLKFSEAIHEAIDICLERDRSTYLMGLGVPDPIGVFGTTKGLQEKYGKKRVLDMPVAENAMTGVALGSCLVGMRPIMTHMRLEFAMTAMDQICNQAAKWHYMFGGQSKVPLTVRMLIGRGWGQGPQHSQSLHAWFAHVPGLKVVMPSTPHDAKGLLIASIEDDNPVVFFEHRWLHNIHGPVPEGHYTVPIGEPRIVSEGSDVTIVAASYATIEAIKAARELARDGIKAELIDLRTIVPRNDAAILASVRKTGRLVVVDQGTLTGGFAGEIVARVTEQAFDALKAAPIRVTLPDIPTPTTRALSNYYYPTPGHIVVAARRTLGLPHDASRDGAGYDASDDPWAGIEPEDKTLDVPDKSFTGPF
jgi:acetoin:2,6-dichlorophenolindophenol oxidoreductase subunit beta